MFIKTQLIRIYTFFQVVFFYSFRRCGKKVRLGRGLFVYPKRVSLGDSCYVGSRCYLDGDISIGDYTMLASNVAIVGGDHPFKVVGQAVREGGRDHWNKTHIGKDVWIGHGAIILNGIQIGDGAIVAAGAVVTKDVQPYSIVVGNPARFLAHRFEFNDQVQHQKELFGG